MLKVKLHETYNQSYWDSGNGVTVGKGQEVVCDEDNWIVRHALDSGILQVVTEQKDNLNIITDIPQAKTIKEVMTPSAIQSNKEALAESNRKTLEANQNKGWKTDNILQPPKDTIKEPEKKDNVERPQI